MSYSSVNETRIIFGSPEENSRNVDELVIEEGKLERWNTFRIAFWFMGKSSYRIYAKYALETNRIELTHRIINDEFHIYYNPKYEKEMIVKRDGTDILVGNTLRLSNSKIFPDSEKAHVFL